MMKNKVSKEFLISSGILMLAVATYFAMSIFNLGHKINSILCFFAFVFIFIATIEKIERCSFICILFFISFIFVLINNRDIKNTNLIYPLTYATLLCLVLYFGNKSSKVKSINWIYKFQKFIYYWGVFSAIATIFFAMFPKVYETIILSITKDTYYYSSLVYCFRNGYQPGISLHYSTNGIYLTLFIGICFINFLFGKRENINKNLIILFIAAIALLFTAKRAHIVFSCFSMIIVYYVKNTDRRKSSIAKFVITFMCIVVLFIILEQFIPALSGFIERFSLDNKNGSLFESRNVLYSYALELFKKNPFFGIGWANYKYMAENNIGQYNEVHNVYLQILTENGIFGAIVFFIIFVYFMHNGINCLKKSIINKDIYTTTEKKVLAYNLFLIVFFVLYCFSGNPLYDMTIWMPVVLYQMVSLNIRENKNIEKEQQIGLNKKIYKRR